MRHFYLYLITGVILLGLLVNSCDAPNRASDSGDDVELKVPADFNFETVKAVTFDIRAHELSVDRIAVEIYDKNPIKGGKRLQKLNVEGRSSAKTVLNLPTHMRTVWIEALGSDGYLGSYEVAVSGSSLNVNLEGMPEQAPVLYSSLDCNTGCDFDLSGVGGTHTIGSGNTICIQEGQSFTGNIEFEGDGGTLRVCGDLNLGSLSYTNNPTVAELYISDTGTATGTHLEANYNGAEITNFGVIDFTNDLRGNGYTFENHGTASFSGSIIRVPGNSTLNNRPDGVFTANSDFQHRGGSVHNEGLFEVTGNYRIENNSGSDLTNDCEMQINGDMILGTTAEATNNGYISVGGTMNIGSNFTFNVGNFSYVETENLTHNGEMVGPTLGNYGRIDINNNTTLNSGSNILNRVDICDTGGIDVNNGFIDSGVTFCQAYIPPTACTPEVGSLPIDDEFPGDPNRIYNNPFPAAGEYGTIMFEDLWPSFGDYDMNDLVVAYNINLVTNLVNEVVDVEFDMVIRAIGASFDSGFGIRLPVDASRVQSVTGSRFTENIVTTTGSGVESGQSQAVIILWDDSKANMGKWVNTVDPADHVPEDSVKVSLTFDPPVPLADLGPAPFDPFIFIEMDRGREVHMAGNEPTDLADPSWFGQEDDTTDPSQGRYYKSETGLSWGLHVPELIPWPKEKISILDAYLRFQSWAESGGTVDTDWYKDLPGNRVNSNLYFAPTTPPTAPIVPPGIPGPPTPGN